MQQDMLDSEKTFAAVVSHRASREALAAIGIRTVQQIARMTTAELAAIPGIGEKTAPQVLALARAFVKGQPVWFRIFPADYRQAGVFLDIRVDPDTRPQWPWGFCWSDVNGNKWHVIVHPRRAPEVIELENGGQVALAPDVSSAWALVGAALSRERSIVYYWGKAVTKHIRYTAPLPVQRQLADWTVDLHPVVTDCAAFPARHTGLQDIAGHLGYRWHEADAPYKAHIAYLIWRDRADRVDLLNEATGYMEDNISAVEHIWRWVSRTQPSD
jgi:predicted RecB family nuclease